MCEGSHFACTPHLIQFGNVGHFPRVEEPRQGQSRTHRLARIPSSLFHNRYDADVILANRDDTSIRWQSNRLRAHKGHSRGRAEHILLDPFNVRIEEPFQKENRQRGAVSRHRKLRGKTDRSQSVQVLSVGVLLPVLSGNLYNLVFK